MIQLPLITNFINEQAKPTKATKTRDEMIAYYSEMLPGTNKTRWDVIRNLTGKNSQWDIYEVGKYNTLNEWEEAFTQQYPNNEIVQTTLYKNQPTMNQPLLKQPTAISSSNLSNNNINLNPTPEYSSWLNNFKKKNILSL